MSTKELGLLKDSKKVAIVQEEIADITERIWTQMLDMQLTPADVPIHRGGPTDGVVASVQLVGETEIAVRLDFDKLLAEEAAGRLLGTPGAELSASDIRDAAGEVANMTGGGIKTLLGNSHRLSLPSVVSGSNFEFGIPHGTIALKTYFHGEHGQLTVTLVERSK